MPETTPEKSDSAPVSRRSSSPCSPIDAAWEAYHGPVDDGMGVTYIPRTPTIYHRGFVDGYEHAQKDADNDTECELAAWELLRKAREQLDAARAAAKFWQEQYGHSNPEHEWEPFSWENDQAEPTAQT